jgi:acyl-coenzyme A synthetase/AMP-(fatty) acid ligase
MGMSITKFNGDRIALTDGINGITYGQLVDDAWDIAHNLSARNRKRFYLDGVTDLEAISYMFGAFIAGKELFCIPSFIPKPVRLALAIRFGAASNVRNLQPKWGKSFRHDGKVSVLTSGTTGKPKMVAFSTRAFTHNDYELSQYGIDENTVVYIPAPMVAAPMPFLMALSAGATIMIEPDRFNPEKLKGVDVVMTTPSNLVEAVRYGRNLKAIMTATGPLSVVQERAARSASQPVYDVYTSTETGIIAVRDVRAGTDFVPYGATEISSDCNDDTEVGMLSVKSPYTMMGYYKNKTYIKNESEFVSNGDLVQASDGMIKRIIRSTDSKVKVSGMSVYLGLIREVALGVPGVTEATVTVIRSEPDDEITLEVNGSTHDQVVSHLKSNLPWYAVPKRVVING